MGTFDTKYAAYERAMQQNNYFGLQGNARGEQFGRYSVALQNEEQKIANRQAGRAFARELAMERKALAQAEQTALTEGLTGTTTSTPVTQVQQPVVTTNPVQTEVKTPDKIKVYDKMRTGTAKTGFKFYLIDKEGNTYQVDRKAYNAAKKGKRASIAGATVVDTTSPKISRKVRNASEKAQKLSGKTPKAKINLITDQQAYLNQQQSMYEKLLGKGEQVPMHNYNLVTDQQAYLNQQQSMYEKSLNTPESHIVEAKGDIRRLEGQLAEATGKADSLAEAVGNQGRQISSLETTVAQNSQTIGRMEQNITSQGNQISSLERTVAQNSQTIGRMEQTISTQGNKISTLENAVAKANKLAKKNGRLALIMGVATLATGVVGYLAGKSGKKENVENNNSETPVQETATTTVSDEVQAETTEEVTENTVNNETQTQTTTTTAQIEEAEEDVEDETQISEVQNSSSLPLNNKGEYTVKQGDSFWRMAEKHLKDKYQDEPEKFENLSNIQKNIMIQKECERIMKLNDYWYDDNHNMPLPMLHEKIRITVSDK